jgi:hypothetical protein
METNNSDVQQYFSELEKLEQQKQGIIDKLLVERKAIDEQLQKLGYKAASKGRPSGAKNKKKASAEK